MTDPELVERARAILHLSGVEFAEEVIGVDARSLRRWQAGDSPIRNREDRAWLEALVALYDARPAVRRARAVG